MTTTLVPWLRQQFFDSFGEPLFLGTLSSFAAGTNTPLATYTDSTGATQNTNPLVLNPRGEGSVWIPPNVAYKFALADSFGNPIWTIDNVVNSQLITLYGGVDTGVANAYLLNFIASFTSYTDGTIIYWIPSHTNTGASTININGLGVIQIQNFDGSALVGTSIIQNQPATILIKSGAAILISASTPTYGTFVTTIGGLSSPTTFTVSYRKNGTLVTLILGFSGTSNSAIFSMSLPTFLYPLSLTEVGYPIVGLSDNGSALAGGMAQINNSGGITFFKDGTQPNWTTSGTKGFTSIAALTYSL